MFMIFYSIRKIKSTISFIFFRQGLGDLTTLTHANFAGIDTNTNGQIDNSEWDSVITALDLDGMSM